MADLPVFEAIRAILNAEGVPFEVLHHPPTSTSEESAQARGEPLGSGAKALLLRTNDRFRLFVLPADRKLVSSAVKKHLTLKRLRFASADELMQLTSLMPGSVPPFGEPILPFELFADESIGVRYEHVAFNAGSLTVSIKMLASDWQRVAKPAIFSFAARAAS